MQARNSSEPAAEKKALEAVLPDWQPGLEFVHGLDSIEIKAEQTQIQERIRDQTVSLW